MEGDAEASLGCPLQALRDDPLLWDRMLHPEDRDRVREACAGLAPGAEISVEYRVRAPGGELRWIRDTMRLRTARPHEAVGLLRDVSVERGLEEKVANLERRAWRSQRMESLGALAAGVVHDFNNLLTTILTSAHLLDDEEDLSHQARSDLALIREAATRGSRIVHQILRFARRGEDFAATEVDIGSTVDELRPILERSLGVNCRLELSADGDLPLVHCDPGQLEQILLNLVVNARDAMPDGGTIRVSVHRAEPGRELETEDRSLPAGSYVVLRVRDTGVGMTERVRERIFEPFFTTKSGDTESGSGVGLSTVRRIVAGYGGGVTVDTEPGRGTTFGIWLPAVPPGSIALPKISRPGRERSGISVLVVAGDPELRRTSVRTLGEDGHAVVAVDNAGDALRLFDRTRPSFDLVVVDWVLPDRFGDELVSALVHRSPELSVVFVAGRRARTSEAAATGAVVLDAPYTPDELRSAVARALEGRGPPRSYKPSAVQ